MRFTLKETYIIFRSLLYVRLKIEGREKLINKIVTEHPEWQRLIDKKAKSDVEIEVFRKRVLG